MQLFAPKIVGVRTQLLFTTVAARVTLLNLSAFTTRGQGYINDFFSP